MFLGRVVGEVWATRKVDDLRGLRLLVVEALDERRDPAAPKITPVIAADPLGAGIGEHVVVAFGKAARVATLGADGDYALEAAIVGIVDDFDIPGAPASWRMTGADELRAARAGKSPDAGASKSPDGRVSRVPDENASKSPDANASKSRGDERKGAR